VARLQPLLRNCTLLIEAAVKQVLRHSFASRLVQGGVSILTVSKLLGHSDVKTTMRYAHLHDANLRDAVDVLTGRNPGQVGTPVAQTKATGTDADASPCDSRRPGQSRTADLRFRKPPLYPAELRARLFANLNSASKNQTLNYMHAVSRSNKIDGRQTQTNDSFNSRDSRFLSVVVVFVIFPFFVRFVFFVVEILRALRGRDLGCGCAVL
jgi:hypothetical protein